GRAHGRFILRFIGRDLPGPVILIRQWGDVERLLDKYVEREGNSLNDLGCRAGRVFEARQSSGGPRRLDPPYAPSWFSEFPSRSTYLSGSLSPSPLCRMRITGPGKSLPMTARMKLPCSPLPE